jgi:hypothetical protein
MERVFPKKELVISHKTWKENFPRDNQQFPTRHGKGSYKEITIVISHKTWKEKFQREYYNILLLFILLGKCL